MTTKTYKNIHNETRNATKETLKNNKKTTMNRTQKTKQE